MSRRDTKVAALLSFNLGVELGQLAILAAVALVLHALRRGESQREFLVPGPLRRTGSVAILVLGLYWFVERV